MFFHWPSSLYCAGRRQVSKRIAKLFETFRALGESQYPNPAAVGMTGGRSGWKIDVVDYMHDTPLIGMMAFSDSQPVTQSIAMMIPIIAIVMGISVGAWSIYINYRKRREMFALYHQERMAAIEKGVELPPLPDEFFREEGGRRCPRSPHSKLLTGLILLFGGLAMLCAMYFTGLGADALWSLVLIGVGAAFLIFYFTVEKKQADLFDAKREAELTSGGTPPKR
jgi:hypothetical protein